MKTPVLALILTSCIWLLMAADSYGCEGEGGTMIVSGVVGSAIGIYDIVTAPHSAKKHNEKLPTFGYMRFSRKVHKR